MSSRPTSSTSRRRSWTSSWSTPRAARSSASTTSSWSATATVVQVAAVDVSSNAILRRVGLAKVGERIVAARPAPAAAPDRLEGRRHRADGRRGGAPRRPADQARAAAPRRHRRPGPRALAGGAGRGVRRARGRPGRRHLRGAAPVVPGVAAARPAGREGQRDPQRDVAGRRRRPAGRPAGRPPPALHRDDGEGRRRGHVRAAQLPRALGRRHHDDQLRLGAPGRHRLQGDRAPARAGRRGRDRLLHLRGRPLGAPPRRLLAARAGHDRRRTGRSASS